MKKIMTKVLSVFMAAAMCVGLCATAFAATTSSTDTGSITINNLDEGVTASAYQIAYATYDDSGNMLGYVMNYTGTTFVINSDGSYNEDTLNEANLSQLYTMVTNAEASATSSATVGVGDTSATISNLPVGTYLIVISGSQASVYGMMVGSVSYVSDNVSNTNPNGITNGSIDVEGDNLWAKKTPGPQVTKLVHTEDTQGQTDHEDYEHGGSADAGDSMTFEIIIDSIPHYEGSNPEFYFDDHISAGLNADLSTIEVYVVAKDGSKTLLVNTATTTYYSVEQKTFGTDDTGFELSFVVNGNYMLNDYADQGYSILVTYNATLDAENATVDDVANTNDVILTYSTNSFLVASDGNEGHSEDEDYVYTFDIDGTANNNLTREILRKGVSTSTSTTEYLDGAGFTLYTDEDCNYPVGSEVFTVSGGYMTWTDLSEGTYWLKETTAPAGYSLNQAVYKIVIDATYGDDGRLTEWAITVSDADGTTISNTSTFTITYNQDGSETASGSVKPTTIYNTKLSELPSMGSTGIALCVIAGCVVLAGAVAGVAIYRRKNNAEV